MAILSPVLFQKHDIYIYFQLLSQSVKNVEQEYLQS